MVQVVNKDGIQYKDRYYVQMRDDGLADVMDTEGPGRRDYPEYEELNPLLARDIAFLGNAGIDMKWENLERYLPTYPPTPEPLEEPQEASPT